MPYTNVAIDRAIALNGKVYIAIGGLIVNNLFCIPSFWYHAIPSKLQADVSEGALFVDVKNVDSVHFSFSVWTSKTDMRKYMSTGAHKEAMKSFRNIATGKFHSYECNVVPNWEEAIALWKEKSRNI